MSLYIHGVFASGLTAADICVNLYPVREAIIRGRFEGVVCKREGLSDRIRGLQQERKEFNAYIPRAMEEPHLDW